VKKGFRVGKIIKIQKIKRSRGWYTVILEGGEYFTANEEIIYRENLKEGDDIDGKTIEQLRDEGTEKKGKEIAFQSLARRERSEKELRERLNRRGIENKAEEKVVKDLKRYDFLNDKKFAVKFVNDYISRKPSGRKLVAYELSRRGISEEIKEEILDDFFSRIDEKELAKKAVFKKIRADEGKLQNDKKKKMYDFLYRRGFNWELIKETLEELCVQPGEKQEGEI